jgi:hypothetical protein
MPVIAVHKRSRMGYVGFEQDTTPLICSKCANGEEYRLFFTENEGSDLMAHRFNAKKAIEAEHPKHSLEIFLHETWLKKGH